MYSTYDDRRRGGRDIPPSSSARYYDSLYAQPSRSSPRYAAAPEADEPERDRDRDRDRHRHRRTSVGGEGPSRKPSRRTPKATVVPSDDGYGYGGAAAYPGASMSRHDAEAKTGEGHKSFRDKRAGYETDEANHLRSKSYSPRAAAREVEDPRYASPQVPPKSTWADDGHTAAAGSDLHRSATTGRKPRQPPHYYADADPRSRHGRARDHDLGGQEYTTASGMPRPPMGDYSPYASSPLSSSRGSDEKVGKHPRDGKPREKERERERERDRDRERETPYYGNGYGQYEPAPETTRHSRHHRPAEDRPGAGAYHDDRYGAQQPPPPTSTRGEHRGRHRPAPPPPEDHRDDDPYGGGGAAAGRPKSHPPRARHQRPPPADEYEDPYDRGAPPPPRGRQRQSMPPPGRSRYGDGYESDQYGGGGGGGPPPRRRASSVNYGRDPRHGDGGGPGEAAGAAAGVSGGGSGGSSSKKAAKGAKAEKGKKIGKQAGKMFMTHAFPVIKQEAVPFLTKAAQAYFEQQRR